MGSGRLPYRIICFQNELSRYSDTFTSRRQLNQFIFVFKSNITLFWGSSQLQFFNFLVTQLFSNLIFKLFYWDFLAAENLDFSRFVTIRFNVHRKHTRFLSLWDFWTRVFLEEAGYWGVRVEFGGRKGALASINKSCIKAKFS